MSLTWLPGCAAGGPERRSGARACRAGADGVQVAAVPGARAAVLAAVVAADPERVALLVTATAREADEVAATLRALLGADAVATFPAWETLPHERLSPRSDTVGRRLAVLRRLAHPDPDDPAYGPLRVVVAPVRAVLQPFAAGLGELAPVAARVGEERPSTTSSTRSRARHTCALTWSNGAASSPYAAGSSTSSRPPRSTRSGSSSSATLSRRCAGSRSPTSAASRSPSTASGRRRAASCSSPTGCGPAPSSSRCSCPAPQTCCTRWRRASPWGWSRWLRSSSTRWSPSSMSCPPGPSSPSTSPSGSESPRARPRRDERGVPRGQLVQCRRGQCHPDRPAGDPRAGSYWSLREVRQHALELALPWWDLTSFVPDLELAAEGDGPSVVIAGGRCPPFRGDTEAAVAAVKEYVAAGLHTVLVTEGAGLAARVVEVLRDHDVAARVSTSAAEPGVVTATTGSLGRGFVIPGAGLAVLTEADLTGGTGATTRDMRRMPSRRRGQIDPLQLRPGDLVVHEQHGVGRFVEMVQRTVAGGDPGVPRGRVRAEQAGQPADRLYVPTDQLDQVTKYVGGEAPTLNKLGGSDWQQTKARARKHVRQIAADLIKLYSARMATRGHAFAPDTPWQRELEDAFAYIETPDQLTTIDEVKADMEREVPMDRLVCGDVGYGKTEIAVRAAFKAVQDGKQVAVLVPTTLLVQQHQQTFSERYAGFPVVVGRCRVSRATRRPRGSRRVGRRDGGCRHRDAPAAPARVRFKDLGLVVVDEEQRFGVEHKEALKALRTAVDVLAMSATPIPRTLEMAITGIRRCRPWPHRRRSAIPCSPSWDRTTSGRSPRRSGAS